MFTQASSLGEGGVGLKCYASSINKVDPSSSEDKKVASTYPGPSTLMTPPPHSNTCSCESPLKCFLSCRATSKYDKPLFLENSSVLLTQKFLFQGNNPDDKDLGTEIFIMA